MDSERFKDKTAVVTGAASGIGEAISRRLLAEGAHVVAADINQERLRELEAEAGGNLAAVVADVTSEEDIARMVGTAIERFGGLNVAFNVAGASKGGPIVDLTEADWDWTVDLVLKGVFLSTKHEARQMRSGGTGGAIVNISSLNAHVPMWGGSPYVAAKAGVELFTKNAALELGGDGIRVNAILPGLVATPLTSAMTEDDALQEDFLGRIPLRRTGTPEDIAAPSLYLASDDAAYVNGTSLVVDGGWEITNYPDLSRYQ